MSIKRRLVIIFVIFAALLLISGLLGSFITKQLTSSLLNISGPTWSSASSVASVIELVNRQSINIESSLRGGKSLEISDFYEFDSQIERAINDIDTVYLVDTKALQNTRASLTVFKDVRGKMLQHNSEYFRLKPVLAENVEQLNFVLDSINLLVRQRFLRREMGDDDSETVEEDALADELVREEAFKTRYSLLAREYELNRFIVQPQRVESLEEMEILWDEMESSIDAIKDDLFSDIAVNGGRKNSLLHTQALYELLAENKQLVEDIVRHFQQLQSSLSEYKLAVNKLNLVVAKLEATMTTKVREQSANAINHAKNYTRMVLLATSIGVLLCFVFLWFALKAILDPIHSVSRQLWDIAESDGDLSVKLPSEQASEVSELAEGFNRFTDKLENVLNQLKQSTKYLCNTTIEITSVGNATENAVGNQHQQIDLIAATMADLSNNIESVAEQTESASETTQTANTEVQKSQNILSDTIASIQQVEQEVQNVSEVLNVLSSDIENISEILDVIRSISDQTNLLALNAAIEAARAGNFGRGFAVVADEVRGLAQRTNVSIEEIEGKIGHLQSSSHQALKAMENATALSKHTVLSANQAGDSLSNVTELIAGISSTNENIATSARGQSSSAASIQKNTEELRESATASSFSAKDLSESTANLVNLASELSSLAAQYKTSKENEEVMNKQSEGKSVNIHETPDDDIDDVLF